MKGFVSFFKKKRRSFLKKEPKAFRTWTFIDVARCIGWSIARD